MVCATSQAVNDWFDRHVDAINEPNRPIPSGRLPGRTGLAIAVVWTFASLGLATVLGAWVFGATLAGLALAWAYSAPPLRLKRNGWWGGAACAACYEGLPWVTGAAMLSGAAPANMVLAAAALYSFGAFGIMTLNDFKSVEGDRATGIDSLPVLLGVENAAQVACVIMAAPQVVVVAMLLQAGFVWQGGTIALLLAGQLALMARLLADPRARAPWYNATGTSLYVAGMMVTAFAISGVGGAP
jgi:chlorophyll synthase